MAEDRSIKSRPMRANAAISARGPFRCVLIASGVDAGISDGKPHGVLALAIADLIADGIPAADALASATSRAAQACGLGDRKGRLHRRIMASAAAPPGEGPPMSVAI